MATFCITTINLSQPVKTNININKEQSGYNFT